MSAYCRICNDNGESSNEDTYVSCNNCGSFACGRHHVWWGVSKNAFCTVCFPKQAAQAVTNASQALQTILNNIESDGAESLNEALQRIAQEFGEMSLEDLITLLNVIYAEISRRNALTDTDSIVG